MNWKLSRLKSSRTFGRRQSPAALPSERLQAPLARVLALVKAAAHVLRPRHPASFNQTNFVRLSVTVPSPLSVKRGVGSGRPPPDPHRRGRRTTLLARFAARLPPP